MQCQNVKGESDVRSGDYCIVITLLSDDSLAYLSYSQINQIVDNAADSMQLTLDYIAPLKKKTVK